MDSQTDRQTDEKMDRKASITTIYLEKKNFFTKHNKEASYFIEKNGRESAVNRVLDGSTYPD